MNSFDVFIIKGFTVCKITDYYHVRVEKNKKTLRGRTGHITHYMFQNSTNNVYDDIF